MIVSIGITLSQYRTGQRNWLSIAGETVDISRNLAHMQVILSMRKKQGQKK
mgnify:CR=1 FL=1